MTNDTLQPSNENLTLAKEDSPGDEGSLERAVRGEYTLDISYIRQESWRLVKGNKGIFWLAFIIAASAP